MTDTNPAWSVPRIPRLPNEPPWCLYKSTPGLRRKRRQFFRSRPSIIPSAFIPPLYVLVINNLFFIVIEFLLLFSYLYLFDLFFGVKPKEPVDPPTGALFSNLRYAFGPVRGFHLQISFWIRTNLERIPKTLLSSLLLLFSWFLKFKLHHCFLSVLPWNNILFV